MPVAIWLNKFCTTREPHFGGRPLAENTENVVTFPAIVRTEITVVTNVRNGLLTFEFRTLR